MHGLVNINLKERGRLSINPLGVETETKDEREREIKNNLATRKRAGKTRTKTHS